MRPSQRSRRRLNRNPLGAIVVLAAIALIAVVVAWLQPGEQLSGRASAVDGDTLRIGTIRVRLTGLDAVELDQRCINTKGGDWKCGYSARDFLAEAVRDRETRCTADGRDRYGRILAKCGAGEGDLGDAIVRAGWAVADLEYGLALVEARANGRGIWSGSFDDPAAWRRSHGDDGFDFWAWLKSWLPR